MKQNIKQNVIITIIMATLIVIALIGTFLKADIKKDALTFKEEYTSLNGKSDEAGKHDYVNVEISEDNPIVYATFEEIKDIIKNKTGIIYFGFPECPWCRNAIPVLLDAAKELEIEKIYYYNALEMRDQKHLDENGKIVTDKEGTKEYQELLELLGDNLSVYEGLNDESIKRLYFPTVVFVKEGKVIGTHVSTVDSQENPYEKLTEEEYNELKEIYSDYINKVYDILCDEAC